MGNTAERNNSFLENRKGEISKQRRRAGYLKSGERSGITQQFGTIHLLSPDAAGTIFNPTVNLSKKVQPFDILERVGNGKRAVEKLPTLLEEAFKRTLRLAAVTLPDEPLPTMLWTPDSHQTILTKSREPSASQGKAWSQTEFRMDYHPSNVVSIDRPKLRRTLERPGTLNEISKEMQKRLTSILTEAAQHFARFEFAKGDAAVDRAFSTSAVSLTLEPQSVALLPLILASAAHRILGEKKSSNPRAGDDRTARYSKLAKLGLERRLAALGADQLLQMMELADRAALRAADQLLASDAMYMIRTEAIERLTQGLRQAASEAIANRSSRIDRARLLPIAQDAARYGSAEILTDWITVSLSNAIGFESRQTLQAAIRETLATFQKDGGYDFCPSCGPKS